MTDPGTSQGAIDVHAHIVPDVVLAAAEAGKRLAGVEYGRDDAGRLNAEVEGKRVTLAWDDDGLDSRLAYMDAAGVAVQLLSLSPLLYSYRGEAGEASDFARRVNDGIAETVRHHPGRFGGYAFLPLQSPADAAQELSRAVTELGLHGGVVGTNVNGADLDECGLDPVFEVAADLRVPLFVHPARVRAESLLPRFHLRNVLGNPLETTMALAALDVGGVLSRFPALRVVLAHGGGFGCLAAGRLDHAQQVRPDLVAADAPQFERTRDQVYVDSLVFSDPAIHFLLSSLGAERVLLGTDYPADMAHREAVTWLRTLEDVTDVDLRAVLHGNAQRLFNL